MENASKALIIAGAILLSILIISLGLMVYNQAKETVGSVNLTQQEIEAFNAKFTAYEGENVSGSKVNSLIQTVIASNQQATEGNTGAYVNIAFHSETDNKVVGIVGADTMKYVHIYDGDQSQYELSNEWAKTVLKTLASGALKDEPGVSLRVVKGKTYNVILDYENGLAKNIVVTQ